ncbi:hypothetical protein ACFWFQ_13435 [Nocardia salmonicida]|uniref:toxin-antitoxin system YwqK family antitoxin n=1 Tax=Nocardia salmonicida TaxID=53431 RepID=UPI0036628BB2
MLFIDSSDPDLTTNDGRAFYRGAPFSGQVSTLLPDQTEVESRTYVDGYLHGQADGWYPDETKRYSGTYDRGRTVLDWEYWNESGRLAQHDVFDFAGNLRHRKRWDKTGTLIEDFDAAALAKPVLDSAIDRSSTALTEDPTDGRLRFDGRPFTGQIVEYFYDGGPVVAVEWFADGYSDGPELAWHGDGARQYAGTVAHSRPIGLWLHWHHNGALAQQNVFTGSGRQVLKQAWDDSGEPVVNVGPSGSADVLDRVRYDGTLERNTPFLHNGRPFTGRLEHRSGEALLSFQDMRDGYADGLSIEYRDGREFRKGVNNPVGPVGCWYEFYPNSRISREDCYDGGNNLLLCRRWDEEGALAAPMAGLAISDRRTDTPTNNAGKASE